MSFRQGIEGLSTRGIDGHCLKSVKYVWLLLLNSAFSAVMQRSDYRMKHCMSDGELQASMHRRVVQLQFSVEVHAAFLLQA